MLFRRLFFYINSATLITKPSLSSFSMSSNGFPIACFLYILPEEQNHHENAAKQKIQTLWEHQIVSCPRSRFSRSRRNCGSDRWWASCHYPRKWSCRTPWAHKLCLRLTWPGSQTSRCKCGVARVLRFQDGKTTATSRGCRSQQGRSREWSRSDRAVTAKGRRDQRQGRRDGEQHAHATNTCFMALEPCVCVTHMKMCGCAQTNWATEKCACDTECGDTLRRTHCGC